MDTTGSNKWYGRDFKPGIPFHAAMSIAPVAEWAVETFNELRIKGNQISIFGHSLGSHVGAEIGRLFKYGHKQIQANDKGIKSIVALDPAFPAKRYDINGNKEDKQSTSKFKDVAIQSTAFVVSDFHRGSEGQAGDNDRATDANNSFLISFPHSDTFFTGELHGAVTSVFTDILTRYSGFEGYKPNSYSHSGSDAWLLEKEHEGIVIAKKIGGMWVYDRLNGKPGSGKTYWV